jgi:putative spermidine/putrescine transport system permease protein
MTLIYLAALAALFVYAFWSVDSFTGEGRPRWSLDNFRRSSRAARSAG